MHLEMTLAAKTASWLFMPYDSMYFLEILVHIGSGTPCDRNMTRNLTELCIGSSHVFYLSKQVGATFKFPTWTRIERRIRNRARQRRLWYFDKLLQTIWMSSVSSLWRTFFFLAKEFSGGFVAMLLWFCCECIAFWHYSCSERKSSFRLLLHIQIMTQPASKMHNAFLEQWFIMQRWTRNLLTTRSICNA